MGKAVSFRCCWGHIAGKECNFLQSCGRLVELLVGSASQLVALTSVRHPRRHVCVVTRLQLPTRTAGVKSSCGSTWFVVPSPRSHLPPPTIAWAAINGFQTSMHPTRASRTDRSCRKHIPAVCHRVPGTNRLCGGATIEKIVEKIRTKFQPLSGGVGGALLVCGGGEAIN